MQSDATLAAPVGRSFLRAGASVLALTFMLMAGLVFTTQTQAHAAPALIGRAVVAIASVASAIPSSPTTGVGDVAYYGNEKIYAGSRDGAVSRAAMPDTKGGRYGALLGALGTGLSLAVGWDFGLGADAAPAGYADAPAGPTAPVGMHWSPDNTLLTSMTNGTSASLAFMAPVAPVAGPGNVAQNTVVQFAGQPAGTYGQGQTHTECRNGSTGAYSYVANELGGVYGGNRRDYVHTNFYGGTPYTCPAGSDFTGGVRFDGNAVAGVVDRVYLTSNPNLPGASTGTGTAGATPVTTTTTSQCTGSGGSYSTAATTITYSRNDTTRPQITIPACNGSDRRTGINQTSTTADGRTVADPIGDLATPIVPAGYELCQTTACALELVRLTPGFAGTPDSDPFVCNGTTGCAGALDPKLSPRTGTRVKVATATGTGQTASESTWAGTDPRAKAPNGREYECRYGPYRVLLNECAPVPHEHPVPPTTPESDSNCNLSDFSLNPISWVVVPLKCLFIPRDSQVQAAATSISSAWNGTAPATVAAAVDDVFSPVVALKDDGGQADCQGPPFTFPALAGVTEPWTLHPLSTCNELTQYLLGIYLPVATALVYLGGFFAGTRLLMRTVNVDSPVQA